MQGIEDEVLRGREGIEKYFENLDDAYGRSYAWSEASSAILMTVCTGSGNFGAVDLYLLTVDQTDLADQRDNPPAASKTTAH